MSGGIIAVDGGGAYDSGASTGQAKVLGDNILAKLSALTTPLTFTPGQGGESGIAVLEAIADTLVSGQFGVVPIGAIIAWHKDFANTPVLNPSFLECNGQVVADAFSPYNGQALPSLNIGNGTGRFLRGSTGTSGADQVASAGTHVHDRGAHAHQTEMGWDSGNQVYFKGDDPASGSIVEGGVSRHVSATAAVGTGSARLASTRSDGAGNTAAPGGAAGDVRPVSMTIVWVMRVK